MAFNIIPVSQLGKYKLDGFNDQQQNHIIMDFLSPEFVQSIGQQQRTTFSESDIEKVTLIYSTKCYCDQFGNYYYYCSRRLLGWMAILYCVCMCPKIVLEIIQAEREDEMNWFGLTWRPFVCGCCLWYCYFWLLLMIPYKGFLLLCTGRSRRTCEMPLYFYSFNFKNGNPELLHSGKGTVHSPSVA